MILIPPFPYWLGISAVFHFFFVCNHNLHRVFILCWIFLSLQNIVKSNNGLRVKWSNNDSSWKLKPKMGKSPATVNERDWWYKFDMAKKGGSDSGAKIPYGLRDMVLCRSQSRSFYFEALWRHKFSYRALGMACN